MSQMKVALLTNEYPPSIYGGAGIHVQFLTQELQSHCDVEVRCFGDQQDHKPHLEVLGLTARQQNYSNDSDQKLLDPLDINLQMCASLPSVDVVHCHTWYSHFAGIVASHLKQAPLILSTHSLEPHRPWKAEQLGSGGYNLSSWIEQHAYQSAHGIIAVSQKMRQDVIELYQVPEDRVQVIYNGIDPDFYQPTFDPAILKKRGIDPQKPFILFVGRITRQKGITQFLEVIPRLNPEIQVVLCAGAPDTPQIAQEMKARMQSLQAQRPGILWIEEMLDHAELRVLYSHATCFVTPSMYEPFGIINLEAMACGIPVVGSAVGGIPEIIIDNETGFLIPLELRGENDFTPAQPEMFTQAFADRINTLVTNPELAQKMGQASRQRAISVFSWKSIAAQTAAYYQEIIERYRKEK